MAKILDGKSLSTTIKDEIEIEVKEMVAAGKYPPGLAVVLVGDDGPSKVYVTAKKKACEKVGIYSLEVRMPDTITQLELISKIRELNNNSKIHGILVQLPLPKHLNEMEAINAIDPRKDVDGFHPMNIGNLNLNVDTFVSCTPLGVMEMINRYQIPVEGKRVLVIGRSNVVGKPMATLLTKANATVTVAHSKTVDLPKLVADSEIIVSAIGKPELIKGEWFSEGAVILDVGTNTVDDPTSPRGYRLVGDVEFEEAEKRASMITPVPGGLGPMTIAMLLSNTLKAKKKYF